MIKSENLNLQRWIYRRGNFEIIFENGWSRRSKFTQERLTVNGKYLINHKLKGYAWLWWTTIYKDTVLVKNGELDLKIQCKSGVKTCKARILIDGHEQKWESFSEIIWTGSAGSWPETDEWSS